MSLLVESSLDPVMCNAADGQRIEAWMTNAGQRTRTGNASEYPAITADSSFLAGAM